MLFIYATDLKKNRKGKAGKYIRTTETRNKISRDVIQVVQLG